LRKSATERLKVLLVQVDSNRKHSMKAKVSNALARWLLSFILLTCSVHVPVAQAVAPTTAAGRTPGTFQVSPVGSAQYTIPIWAPPGQRGMRPSLSLSYDSNNTIGPLGVGWSLSGLGAITRCGKTVAQDGTAAPVALVASDGYCINGKRMQLTSAASTYGQDGSTYETEVFDLTLITAKGQAGGNGPAYFTVQGPDGTTYYYGFTDANNNGANSQVPANGTQTALTWLLSKVVDTAGNNYVINYTTASGALQGTAVPSTIFWTPTGASSYAYEMQFNYGANVPQSSISKYVAGTPISNNQLLSSIEILNLPNTVVKEYFLTYQSSRTTGRQELIDIQECADSAQSSCLAPTTATYAAPQPGLSSTPLTSTSVGNSDHGRYDLNGDGYPDLLYSGGSCSSGSCVAFGSSTGYGGPNNIPINGAALVLTGRIVGTPQDGFLAAINGTWSYYYWNGASFNNLPMGIPYDSTARIYQLADINGDGKPDLIELTATGNVMAYLNTSSGGNASFSTTAISVYSAAGLGCGAYPFSCQLLPPDDQFMGRTRRYDFNGDGQDDLVLLVAESYGTVNVNYYYELISTPGGTSMTATEIAVSSDTNPTVVHFLNWNDDTCTDFLTQNGSNEVVTIYIAGCNGTSPTSYTVNAGGPVIGAMDWDGDTRTDLLVGVGSAPNLTYGAYLSTASGIGSLQTSSVPYGSCYLSDVNGDGLDDVVCWQGSGQPLVYYLHNGHPDLVTQFQDGYGNYAKPSYVFLPQSVNVNYFPGGSPQGTYLASLPPMYLASHVDFNDPSGSSPGYSQDHYYTGSTTDISGRGFAGFGEHQILDSRNGLWTTLEYEQLFPFTGMLGSTTVSLDRSFNQPLLQSGINGFSQVQINTINPSQPIYAVSPQAATVDSYELSGSGTRLVTHAVTTSSYDNYGNLLTSTMTVTDEDSSNSNPYNGDSWTTTTTNSPVVDTTPPSGTNWCLNLMTQTAVTYNSTDTTANNTGPGVVTRTKQFTPDTTNCRYTQIVTAPSTPYAAFENLTYDSFGNILYDQVSATGTALPTQRTTQVNWGVNGQFPAWMQDPMFSTTLARTHFTYNSSFGFLTSVRDQNNATTQWTPDAFGRKQTQTNPDGTKTTWSYQSCALISGCPSLAQEQTIATTTDSAGNYIRDVQGYSDAADRVIQQLSRNANTGTGNTTYTLQTWAYDALGRLAKRGVPALASVGTGAPQVTYSYDKLNRVLSEVYPVNGSTATKHYGYSGRTTTIQDGNSHTRTLISDVNGWLRQTKDAMGTNAYAITLGYDAAGSRNSVTDSQGNTLWNATYQYGIAPFMVSSTDTDLGAWTYSYDGLGELLRWQDAKGQSFSMTYDPLSRPVTRSEPDLFTQWTWGSSAAAYEIGQLHSVCTGTTTANPATCDGSSYAESETYDSAERPLTRQIQIPGDRTYTYSWAYNSMGLPDTVTYPATPQGFQLQLKYGYTNGIPTSITDIVPDNIPLWSTSSSTPVDGFGHYLQETLGNGVQVTHQFKADTGLISSITAVKGSTSLQNNSYLFDNVGNLSWRGDGITGASESVYNDADDRLSYTVGDTNTQLTYDSMGRLASWFGNTNDYTTAQPGCTYYPNAQLHAVRQNVASPTNKTSFCYDANGNMVSSGGSPITWTSYNQPASIPGWNGSSQFSYDHNHQRWQQTAIFTGSYTETTEYIGSLMEKVSNTTTGTTYRYYVPAGNNLAVYECCASSPNPNPIYYVTKDHLGSSALITDRNGSLQLQEKFAALGWLENFGDLIKLGGITRIGFTAQDDLDNIGEVNMKGRVYNPSGGYFLSPDPFIPYPDDTRSYNRYAYVRYNPLTHADPSGFNEDCIPSDTQVCLSAPPLPWLNTTNCLEIEVCFPTPPPGCALVLVSCSSQPNNKGGGTGGPSQGKVTILVQKQCPKPGVAGPVTNLIGYTWSVLSVWAGSSIPGGPIAHVGPGPNGIRVTNSLINFGGRAVTLGNYQIFTPVQPPQAYVLSYSQTVVNVGRHEDAHTYQAVDLGDLYLPMIGIDALLYGDNSPMELDADAYANGGCP
jgi:RHS repeat-associated protein